MDWVLPSVLAARPAHDDDRSHIWRWAIAGEGLDRVGPFTFHGDYDLADGKCRWVKQYLGRHHVTYTGINQGQGIWGVWEYLPASGPVQRPRRVPYRRQVDTPTEEAEATVKAYLSLPVLVPAVPDSTALFWTLGSVFVSVFLIRQLYYVMTGISGP